MALRPLPEDVRNPGGHLVLIDPDRWSHNVHEEEECLCHTPHLEWRLSPLGAPVEIHWASADHLLCLETAPLRRDLLPHAHPGIAAEALYARRHLAEFDAIVRSSPDARAHVLAIPDSFHDDGMLVEAQHHVRALRLRESADLAVEEALR